MMKILAGLLFWALSCSFAAAYYEDTARPEAMVAFAAKRESIAIRHAGAPMDVRTPVQQMIRDHVTARIGAQWVGTALRIAKIESGFRCNARNGRAVGIYQNTNPAMFGVSRGEALTCSGGVRAGVAHMAMCIGKGARTAAQMMICHNAGTPFARRVERAYRVALRS